MDPSDDPLDAVVGYLEHHGLEVERCGGGRLRVRSSDPTAFAHVPVVDLPDRLLRAHLDRMAAQARDQPDPAAEALTLFRIHVLEELTTDHGGGTNRTRAVALRRGRDGRPEFVVEGDPPDPVPLDPGSGPYEWRAERP